MVIEPGLIKTSFAETAAGSMPGRGGPVRGLQHSPVTEATVGAYDGPHGAPRGRPEAVASAISKAHHGAAAEDPLSSDRLGPLLLAQRKMMPDRAWDAMMGTSFRRPGADRISRTHR